MSIVASKCWKRGLCYLFQGGENKFIAVGNHAKNVIKQTFKKKNDFSHIVLKL